ncbi:MAG: aminoglycoside 3'-phosphotransferase [Acidimicrobiia bacterium]
MTTPAIVANLARGQSFRLVWVNELGGLTFEMRYEDTDCFLKWAPVGSGLDLAGEAARLRWVAPFTTAPRVLDIGEDNGGSWLLTQAIRGNSAASERWTSEPQRAVIAIGQGLRHLHDRAPVTECPFTWSIEDRVGTTRQRYADGQLDPTRWDERNQGLEITNALARLDRPPSIDRLVVCHGDACAPNTLVGEDGLWAGHVDFGSLGSADRWADLAVATWSTEWNYGPGWEQPLLDAYGIEPDEGRTEFYRLLWDLS